MDRGDVVGGVVSVMQSITFWTINRVGETGGGYVTVR